jgi:NADPH:quinone reductase-like Zn-dependent oxidoreductase
MGSLHFRTGSQVTARFAMVSLCAIASDPQRQAKRRPGPDEVLVRVTAAGVGPWDDLIREHKSVVKATPPLILGADLSA